MIGSIEITIGGGKGYWCKGCNKLYKHKPYRCQSLIDKYNYNKIRQTVEETANMTDDEVKVWLFKDVGISWNEEMYDIKPIKVKCNSYNFVHQYKKGQVADRICNDYISMYNYLIQT